MTRRTRRLNFLPFIHILTYQGRMVIASVRGYGRGSLLCMGHIDLRLRMNRSSMHCSRTIYMEVLPKWSWY